MTEDHKTELFSVYLDDTGMTEVVFKDLGKKLTPKLIHKAFKTIAVRYRQYRKKLVRDERMNHAPGTGKQTAGSDTGKPAGSEQAATGSVKTAG